MLGIIVVAYKNPERTAEYINKYITKLFVPHVVVVVNNASTFNECETLASICGGTACSVNDTLGYKPVYVVHSSENLGFARGNNLGVEFLRRNCECEYLLFSNDDLVFEEEFSLDTLIDILKRDSSVGAIGPAVIGLDGKHQSPHRRIVSAYRQIGWHVFSRLRKSKRESKGNSSFYAPEEGFCYWVSGAFFLMRTSDFTKIHGFDPDTFLYCEEPIIAEKLHGIGKSMYYCPKIRVIHQEGATTKSVATNSRIKKWIVESNCIYYIKYRRTPRIVVRLYKYLALRNG